MLVDGSSYLFRAYHALPQLTNRSGQNTGAILGVINMLKKLCATYKPQWVVIVFDSKEPTFRHELYPEYKIHRTKIPPELSEQIPYVKQVITALGFTLLQIPRIEADDIIGTLVAKFKSPEISIMISTGDKDFAQLVDDNVVLINTMTDELLDPLGIMQKFKVPPRKIRDYLVLTGDQADNIPGVKNVGPKTAVKWLELYEDLNGITLHQHDIPGKAGENLRAAIKNFPLYLKLVTINSNIDLSVELEDFKLKAKDHPKLTELFTQLEFYSWLKELNQTQLQLPPEQITTLSSNETMNLNNTYNINLSLDQILAKWVKIIEAAEIFAIHVTTTVKEVLNTEITGIYLANNTDDCYIKLDNFKELISSVKLNRDHHVEKYSQANNLIKLLNYLKDPSKTKITYNLKNLLQILDNYGIIIEPKFYDVMLELYLINNVSTKNIDPNVLTAKQILALHYELLLQIRSSPKILNILENIEIPLSIVLKNMERTGVLIDPIRMTAQSKIIYSTIKGLVKKIYRLAGTSFNLNSPKQLQEILFDKLGLPILEKTPTGQLSTSEKVLEELSLNFELPKLMLQYRTLSKLQANYTDKLPKLINAKTGRIHTTYNQTVTVTGRLSSSDPNLQNIPIKTIEGKNIRDAFIPRAGYKILSADYSQIELRILAHLSEDPGLINAFANNIDIHTMTASEIFQIDLNEVSPELRRKAKAINFGLIYGMSDFGLSKQLKISKIEAATYIDTYFAKFPRVLAFMDDVKKFAASHGFVETIFGRRLYLPDLNHSNKIKRKSAERAAINAPMQGSQADLIKLAMIKLDHWIKRDAQDIFMLMQVHDELVFEVPTQLDCTLKSTTKKSQSDHTEINSNLSTNNKINLMVQQICTIMQEVATLKVELKVDIGIGDSWGQAHPG